MKSIQLHDSIKGLSHYITLQYADSKLALGVNELIRKIYLNADSLTNLQADMLSRIKTQRDEINSYFNGKISTLIAEQTEMLGKIHLNESTIVTLCRETNELVGTKGLYRNRI